jgi:hypothetical protein
MPSDPWTNEHPLYNLNNLQAAIQQEHPNWLALETLALAVRLRKELHRFNRSWLRSEAKWRRYVVLSEAHRYQSGSPARNWRV